MGGRSSRLRARLGNRWARARTFATAVVVVASASTVVGLGSAEGGTGDPGPSQPTALTTQLQAKAAGQPPSTDAMAGALAAARDAAAEARAQEAARLENVRSAEGVVERARSRTAYAGLGREDAAGLLQRHFGSDIAAASRDPQTIGTWSPVQATSDHALTMDDGHGHRAVLASTAPVQTDAGKIVDLGLGAAAGGWAPKAPLIDLRLP